jgi:large subunit ribosomal protein L2
MALKKFRPLTPSQRFKIATDNSDITTSTPEKSLLTSVKKVVDVIILVK